MMRTERVTYEKQKEPEPGKKQTNKEKNNIAENRSLMLDRKLERRRRLIIND